MNSKSNGINKKTKKAIEVNNLDMDKKQGLNPNTSVCCVNDQDTIFKENKISNKVKMSTNNNEKHKVNKPNDIQEIVTDKVSESKFITFAYSAPEANNVFLVGDFNDWDMGSCPLKKNDSGNWATSIKLELGTYAYKFLVDGHWYNDPKALDKATNEFGTQNDKIIIE